MEISKLAILKRLCFDCDTDDCVFNFNGECRFAFVRQRAPIIVDDEGCLEGVIDLFANCRPDADETRNTAGASALADVPDIIVDDLAETNEGRNTRIEYLYRDASNYKIRNACVVKGTLTEAQQAEIYTCLVDGEYFIPGDVGLPETRFAEYTEDDHPWFEMDADAFSETALAPDVDITADELVDAFRKRKDGWQEEW